MYGLYYHFNNLRFNNSLNSMISPFPFQVLFLVSSEFLKCRLLKWLLARRVRVLCGTRPVTQVEQSSWSIPSSADDAPERTFKAYSNITSKKRRRGATQFHLIQNTNRRVRCRSRAETLPPEALELLVAIIDYQLSLIISISIDKIMIINGELRGSADAPESRALLIIVIVVIIIWIITIVMIVTVM